MDDVKKCLSAQRKLFSTGKTKTYSYRMEQLGLLYHAIKKHETEIEEALRKDLNKAPFEAYETEIGIVLEEIKYTRKHLKVWMQPKRVSTPMIHFPASSCQYQEPYGSVLIMSPWNYPFQLTMAPLIGAIAAGNCSIVKPSGYSSFTSEVIGKILGEIYEEAYVAVIKGGREANQTLLDEKFDYIFFTGSPQVGRVVMQSASRYLTPVTLELGGKSPCIVDETAHISLAAKRIVWGKFLNAGQTCVAPDYLLVHHAVKEKLIQEMIKYIGIFYGTAPLADQDYPKIINQKHFNRLTGLMKKGKIVTGGETDEESRKIAPTIIEQISWEDEIMQEEIFGPLLPVMEYTDEESMIARLQAASRPLALYHFTTDKKREKRIIGSLSFGGGCINDTIIHLSNPNLTFGGVGESGMGQYHGKGSFDTFSHYKSIIRKSNMLDIDLRYPPFHGHLDLLKKIME